MLGALLADFGFNLFCRRVLLEYFVDERHAFHEGGLVGPFCKTPYQMQQRHLQVAGATDDMTVF